MDCKGAFLELEVEIKLLHALKGSLGAFGVFDVIVGVDKEVVHVDDKPTFCNHVMERVGHALLARGGGVCHAKEHDRRCYNSFSLSFYSIDCSLSSSTYLER